MSARRLSDRDLRALRLGVVVLVPALVFAFGVRPYLGALAGARERLRSERELFAREAGLLAAAGRYDAWTRASEEALAAEAPRLFLAPEDLLALADLSAYVEDLARLSRVLVLEAGGGRVEPVGGGLVALRRELRAESDLDGTLRFLRRLEHGPKLVRVEGLGIEAARPRAAGEAGDYEALRLSLSVTAYTIADADADADGAAPGADLAADRTEIRGREKRPAVPGRALAAANSVEPGLRGARGRTTRRSGDRRLLVRRQANSPEPERTP